MDRMVLRRRPRGIQLMVMNERFFTIGKDNETDLEVCIGD